MKDIQKYMESRNSMKVHLNKTTTLMKAAYGKT